MTADSRLNQLENWLVTQLEPRIDVKFHEETVDGHPVVVFEVQAAAHLPVRFRGEEYVRIGSYNKPLADHPEKERALWALFSRAPFETSTTAPAVSSDEVLALIDYPEYFRLMKLPLPDNRAAILRKLTAERVILRQATNRYDITNVGAVLFARSLQRFERLARKALRIIIYRGNNRVQAVKELLVDRGYAVGFEGAVAYINDQLPQNEQIGQALRQQVRIYPEIAIRELVRIAGNSTVTVLLGPRTFADMDREERIRACYQHACLPYVSGERMTNATLRQRLGIKESNYPLASRIIRDTIDGKLIQAHLIGSGGKKDSSYVPFWA